jgi:CheY-like chemotaxis protein
MSQQNRFDIFEPGDPTALLCMDVPEMERLFIEQLTELKYRVHTGLSIDDLLLKMRAHVYDVVIISEHLGGSNVKTNPVLLEAIHSAAINRRKQLLILVGASFRTGDELQAFAQSVDLVIGLADAVNLRPLLRRGLLRAQEFYAPLQNALKEVA